MTVDAAEERTTVDTIAAAPMRADAEAATEVVAVIETERMIAAKRRRREEDAPTARKSLTILLSIRKRKSILMKIWLKERSKSSITMTIKRTKAKKLLLKRRRPAKMSKPRTYLKNNRVASRSLLKKIQRRRKRLPLRRVKQKLSKPRQSLVRLRPIEK